jgi:hypothetical protein
MGAPKKDFIIIPLPLNMKLRIYPSLFWLAACAAIIKGFKIHACVMKVDIKIIMS